MMAPSYSIPPSVFIVIGDKDFHTIVSQTLTAINNEIPDPKPYPFDNISSKRIIMYDAMVNYMIIRMALPAPNLSISPYIPL